MARIRSIHPGLFTDEAFLELTRACPAAIPLLLGLWCEADDAGSFAWKPNTLKARILPVAPVVIEELLGALLALNFIRKFEIDGQTIGVVRNFVKFQRPKRPIDVHPFSAATRLYAGFAAGARPHAATGRPPAQPELRLVPNTGGTRSELSPQREEGGGRMEEEGEGNKTPEALASGPHEAEAPQNVTCPGPAGGVAAIAPRPRAPGATRATRLDPQWAPSAEGWRFAEAEIGLDAARRELARFHDYWAAKARDAGKLDWDATWRNWIRKAAEDRTNQRAGQREGPLRARPSNFRMAAARKVFAEETSRHHGAGHGAIA
jgi:hypothetical protein